MSEVIADTSLSPTVPIAGARPASALIEFARRGIEMKSMADVVIVAKAIVDSGMAPSSFNTWQKVLVAIQFGAEVGLPPMAALQGVAVINGKPTLYGDAVPGLCNASGLIETYKDEEIGEAGTDGFGVRVTVKRKDRADPIIRTFTVADAKKAGLWGKGGPWSQYANRMLLMRARTFAMRDACPEVMRGLRTAEEMRDHPEKNITPTLDSLEAPKT